MFCGGVGGGEESKDWIEAAEIEADRQCLCLGFTTPHMKTKQDKIKQEQNSSPHHTFISFPSQLI